MLSKRSHCHRFKHTCAPNSFERQPTRETTTAAPGTIGTYPACLLLSNIIDTGSVIFYGSVGEVADILLLSHETRTIIHGYMSDWA